MMTPTGRSGDWRAASACLRADPDLFFPISGAGPALKQIAQAKAICADCSVRGKCLDFARQQDPLQGIWGGTTPEERLRARRREQRAARARAKAKPQPRQAVA
jgi:WhiB family transcriptional regulator, redox-sensing transcriptional regulator